MTWDWKSPHKALIGMVHVRALPATPRHNQPVRDIVRIAVEEARTLHEAGFDAVLLENMHDVPYLRRHVGPEIIAAMTAVATAVRAAVNCPVGIQILAGANREALAVAHVTGADFIRAEGFVFSHIADEGWMDADAGKLLRYRRALGAERVKIFADVKKKHSSHAVTADVDIAETARAAEFFAADGIVVTGVATGRETSPKDLQAVYNATRLPVLVGSGTTPDSLERLWQYADGFIIGSWLKHGGCWEAELDPDRIHALVKTATGLRSRAA